MPGEYESFVNIDVWTMIFAWGNIVILFLFLRKILFKPIKKMIDTRQKEIQDMYTDAQKFNEEAQNMRIEYQGKLEKAAEESDTIVKEAVQRAQQKEDAIIKDAQLTAANTMKRATEEVTLEKKKAMNELKNQVSDMAVEIASAVLKRDIKEEDNNKIIDQFIENLGDTK